jgi:hypothetical protein
MAGVYRVRWRRPPRPRFVPTAVAGSVTIVVDTPGALTFSGQAPPLRLTIAATPGALTFAGQTIGLTNAVTPTPGAITF